ncbi:MAG: amino acid adenylation domain-containing protein, partial [Bifidobacteriaceae bacterium]|nr:amino acid adenylation domain-containing protein [Bifidobacteriaceae bacterium]
GAAAVAAPDHAGEMAITAFITADAPLDTTAVRRDLAHRMAPHLIPARIAQIERIPLTPNGQPDRRNLAELARSEDQDDDSEGDQRGKPAPSQAEQAVLAAFAQALGRPVALDENFFDAGGHSLRATAAINTIEELTAIRLPMAALFQNPTARQLALQLAAAVPPTGDAEKVTSAGGPGDYPMSSAQRRLYVLEQMGNAGTAYNIPAIVELRGAVDPARARAAYAALVERHEALRTSFPGPGVQRVHATAPAELDEVEVAAAPAGARVPALLDGFVRPFDLARAPLARLRLVRAATGPAHLLVDVHHSIADGTSLKVLLGEFSALYEGRELPPVAFHYKDYAAAQARADLTAHRAYWLDRCAEPPEPLDLPTDYPRPAVPAHAAGRASTRLEPELRARLARLAAERGATEYMALAAALAALLGKQGRSEDFNLGSVVSGRNRPGSERLVGMAVNTLVLRAQPRRDASFSQLLDQVRASALGALEHQDYPFEDIVAEAAPARDLSRHPLFDVCFVLQNMEDAAARLEGVDLVEVPFRWPTAQFDLTFSATPAADGGCEIDIDYRLDLFSADSAAALARHFHAMVANAVANPGAPLADVAAIDAAERAKVVHEFNDTGAGGPAGATLASEIAARCAEQPDATAVLVDGRAVSRAELDRRSAQLAARLLSLGAGPGRLVAILADRGLNTVVAVTAILRSGAAFVPLDPMYPAERLAGMIADAAPTAILTAGPELPVAVDVPVLDLEDPALYDGPAQPLPPGPGPEDLAYCMFTSGSTGRPKGALVPHRAAIAACFEATFAEICPKDRPIIAWTSNYCFDVMVLDLIRPLVLGVPVALALEGDLATPEAFTRFVERSGATTVVTTPSRLDFLAGAEDSFTSRVFGINVGGEVLGEALARRVQASGAILTNAYGPTETAVAVTAGVVDNPGDITIGRPVGAAQILILDGDQPAGVSMPGELCVAGAMVGLGYLDRPDLTAQRFPPNPLGQGRVYRSGDLARWRADGRIEFLGRADDQVKIRGLRVELGE